MWFKKRSFQCNLMWGEGNCIIGKELFAIIKSNWILYKIFGEDCVILLNLSGFSPKFSHKNKIFDKIFGKVNRNTKFYFLKIQFSLKNPIRTMGFKSLFEPNRLNSCFLSKSYKNKVKQKIYVEVSLLLFVLCPQPFPSYAFTEELKNIFCFKFNFISFPLVVKFLYVHFTIYYLQSYYMYSFLCLFVSNTT